MSDKLGIGIIGCGNISTTYFKLAPLFRGLEVRACADVNPAAAEAQAQAYGVRPQTRRRRCSPTPRCDVVINLTIPDAHYPVSTRGARGRQARLFREAAGAVASRTGWR